MEQFGTVHLIVNVTLVIIAIVLIVFQRRGKNWPLGILAFANLSAYAINQAAYSTVENPALDNQLPFHLCDVTAFVAGFALLTRNRTACELAYCWGLAGTLQALISPNVPYTYPHPVFFSFFLQHGFIVITALFLPLALKWKPREGTMIRVILWGQVYLLFGFIINWSLNTNFGFLLAKPDVPSLLDHLGPWPWYIISLELVAALFYFLFLLPWAKSINLWRFRGMR